MPCFTRKHRPLTNRIGVKNDRNACVVHKSGRTHSPSTSTKPPARICKPPCTTALCELLPTSNFPSCKELKLNEAECKSRYSLHTYVLDVIVQSRETCRKTIIRRSSEFLALTQLLQAANPPFHVFGNCISGCIHSWSYCTAHYSMIGRSSLPPTW